MSGNVTIQIKAVARNECTDRQFAAVCRFVTLSNVATDKLSEGASSDVSAKVSAALFCYDWMCRFPPPRTAGSSENADLPALEQPSPSWRICCALGAGSGARRHLLPLASATAMGAAPAHARSTGAAASGHHGPLGARSQSFCGRWPVSSPAGVNGGRQQLLPNSFLAWVLFVHGRIAAPRRDRFVSNFAAILLFAGASPPLKGLRR